MFTPHGKRCRLIGRTGPVLSFRLRLFHRPAFSLIEVLVVIAIIGILIALLMPAVQSVRESARRSQCQNNLRQIGLALNNYHDQHGVLPSGWIGVTNRAPAVDGASAAGWGTMVLPQVEQGPLSGQFNSQLDVRSPQNAAFRATPLPVFTCPSNIGPLVWETGSPAITVAAGSYPGMMGSSACTPNSKGQCKSNGVFFHLSKVTFNDVLDGDSNTLLVGERGAVDSSGPVATWVGAVPSWQATLGVASGVPQNPPTAGDGFSSWHPGGAQFVFCDGHVKFLNASINQDVYHGAATLAGEEPAGDF